MKNTTISKIILVTYISLGALPMPAFAFTPTQDPRPPVPHTLGTNIAEPSGTVFTITTENGQTVRRPYTSGGAFLSYGFNSWSNVQPANSSDSAMGLGSFIPPRDGTIMCSDRGSDKGTCYLISESTKLGFPSEQIFKAQGFSFSRALYGDVSFLPTGNIINDANQAHSPGVIVNKDGTLYLVGTKVLLGFPNANVFTSWGYTFSDAVMINPKDLESLYSPIIVLPQKNPGIISPFHNTLANGDITLQGINAGYIPGPPDTGATLYLNTQTYGQIKISIPGFMNCPASQIDSGKIGDTLEVHGNYSNGVINICSQTTPYYIKKINADNIQIYSLSPSFGPVGSQITITGSGFTTDNKLSFGNNLGGRTSTVSSSDGKTITFDIPYAIIPPGPNCVPPMYCASPTPYPVIAGKYNISITNSNGTSNSLIFTVTELPFISQLNPSSGLVGTQITITGSGFSSTSNTVYFFPTGTNGPGIYPNKSSLDGKTIIFTIPGNLAFGCEYGPTPCPAAYIKTDPGIYNVSVLNTNGKSNSMQFTVTQ